MEAVAELVIPIVSVVMTFSSLIVFIYFHYTSRNRERMALIEAGKDAGIFKNYREKDKNRPLKLGIVSVMLGLGIFLGYVLEQIGIPGEVAYFSMILILGGLGLVGYYLLIEGKKEKEQFRKSPDESYPV